MKNSPTSPSQPLAASGFEELWGSASQYVAHLSIIYWSESDGDTLH